MLAAHGLRQSMSRPGDCWDNAVAESIFATLEHELLADADFHTRREAHHAVAEFIESWYNPERRVHELVILDGPAGHLQNPLIHYNYSTLREFRQRQTRYSDYDASVLHDAGQRARLHNFVLQPLREFRRRFFSQAGYRDHVYGVLLSALMAYYEFVKYHKLWRLQR